MKVWKYYLIFVSCNKFDFHLVEKNLDSNNDSFHMMCVQYVEHHHQQQEQKNRKKKKNKPTSIT